MMRITHEHNLPTSPPPTTHNSTTHPGQRRKGCSLRGERRPANAAVNRPHTKQSAPLFCSRRSGRLLACWKKERALSCVQDIELLPS